MQQQFNDELLEAFIHKFYGYGNFKGKYWFVGLEQGGGNSFQEVETRLAVWDNNQRPMLEDAAEYHRAIGLGHFFDKKQPKLQATWARLIRTLFGFEGKTAADTPAKDIVAYQRDRFLRLDDTSCSVELLPLPSPSMNKWLYADHSKLEYLKTRAAYRAQFIKKRADTLRHLIETHSPKFVMFYGLHPEYVTQWKYIANTEFTSITMMSKFNVDVAKNGATTYIISKHPVAHGLTSDYWHKLGHIIAQF